jgi:hypothetical protein
LDGPSLSCGATSALRSALSALCPQSDQPQCTLAMCEQHREPQRSDNNWVQVCAARPLDNLHVALCWLDRGGEVALIPRLQRHQTCLSSLIKLGVYLPSSTTCSIPNSNSFLSLSLPPSSPFVDRSLSSFNFFQSSSLPFFLFAYLSYMFTLHRSLPTV